MSRTKRIILTALYVVIFTILLMLLLTNILSLGLLIAGSMILTAATIYTINWIWTTRR